MSELLFEQLASGYKPGSFSKPISFYFSMDSIKKTVVLGPDGCQVRDGKPEGEADCVCKMTPEMFSRIWNEGYRPGMKDFMSGAIKSNAPALLQEFMQAFGK